MKHRPIILVVFLLVVLSGPLYVAPVDAGPLNSFATSPISYWDDQSNDTTSTWDSALQTINVSYSELNESNYHDGMEDVDEWSVAGGGNAPTSTGSIMEWAHPGDSAWDFIQTDEPSCLDGWTLYIRYRSTVDVSDTLRIYAYTQDGAGGSSYVVQTLSPDTTWRYHSEALTQDTECIRFGGYASSAVTFQVDYLSVRSGLGELDLGIPINRQDIQEINMFVNVTGLNSEVQLEMYNDATSSGMYCHMNSSYITFQNSGIIGTTSEIADGLVRISFNVFNELSYGEITVGHQNQTISDYWRDEYLLTGNNFLRFTDSAFNGSFTLFYLNGDTNYTTTYNTPEWTKTGTDDAAITQHLLGMTARYTNDDINHDVLYQANLPFLGYLRTEISYIWDSLSTGNNYFSEWNITIDTGTYTSLFSLNFTYSSGASTFYATVKVYNSSYNFYETEIQRTAIPEAITDAKIMFWRTQEDNIGIMFWGETDLDTNELWATGWDRPRQEYIEGENETIWISDFAVDDWSDTSVSIGYEIDGAAATDDANLEVQLNYFEYEYMMSSGVVQPHFSSVYWGGRGTVRDEHGDVVDLDDWDGYNDPIENEEPVPWWRQLARNILDFGGSIISTAGDIIGRALSMAGDAFVGGVLAAINLLGAVWATVINGIFGAGTAGAISGVFTGIAATIGAIGSGITLIFTWLTQFISWVSWGVTYITDHLMNEEIALLITLALLFPIAASLGGQSIMGKGTGITGAVNWVTLYASVFIMIISAAWRIILAIINTVANFIPLT